MNRKLQRFFVKLLRENVKFTIITFEPIDDDRVVLFTGLDYSRFGVGGARRDMDVHSFQINPLNVCRRSGELEEGSAYGKLFDENEGGPPVFLLSRNGNVIAGDKQFREDQRHIEVSKLDFGLEPLTHDLRGTFFYEVNQIWRKDVAGRDQGEKRHRSGDK